MSSTTGQPLLRLLLCGLDLLLPRLCPGCGRPGQWCAFCAAALAAVPRRVRLATEVLDRAAGLRLPPVWALTRYQGPVRAAILAGKEHGRVDLPPLLGAALGQALWPALGALTSASNRLGRTGATPGRSPTLWLVPAPSRRTAAQRRGGDPVTAMARAAARQLAARGVPAGVARCLFTERGAADSVGLSPAQRVANLSGRVRLDGAAVPSGTGPVVVLDDVVTTGATLISSLEALTDAGIRPAAFLALAAAAPWLAAR